MQRIMKDKIAHDLNKRFHFSNPVSVIVYVMLYPSDFLSIVFINDFFIVTLFEASVSMTISRNSKVSSPLLLEYWNYLIFI